MPTTPQTLLAAAQAACCYRDYPAQMQLMRLGLLSQVLAAVNPTGVIVSTVTGMTGTMADSPVLAADGNFYITDNANSTIRRFTPSGVLSVFAGLAGVPGGADGIGSAARFNAPFGLALDPTRQIIYVSSPSSGTIRKIVIATAQVTTLAGTDGVIGGNDGTGPLAQFNFSTGLGVDKAGMIYCADVLGRTIRQITPVGVVTTLAGTYLAPAGNADGIGPAATFNDPFCAIPDNQGNLFVTTYGMTVRKIVIATRQVTTFAGLAGAAGGTDGTGAAARFNYPQGLVIAPDGNMYEMEAGGFTVRKITPQAVVTTIAGTYGVTGATDGIGTLALFTNPGAPTIMSNGDVYLVDGNNDELLRKLTFMTADPAGLLAQAKPLCCYADTPANLPQLQLMKLALLKQISTSLNP